MMESIVTIVVAIAGSGGLWAFAQHIQDNKITKKSEKLQEINDKLDKIVTTEDLTEIKSDIKELKQEVYHAKDLSLSTARNKLNYLCNKYTKLGYIPFEDYVAFKSIGESYIRAGGNTEIKTKFEWVMDNLEPKATK